MSATMRAVDIALLLAFDGSASITYDEFGLITEGCARALRDADVAQGLLQGPLRGSLCALLLWSGPAAQDVLVPWTRLSSGADLDAFATAVANVPRAIPPGTTAIGSALLACQRLLHAQPAPARRRIIDVAGDGRSNDGPPPGPIRDRLAASGVTINGLCVLHEEPDLVESYTREVIGGPDSFALACKNYREFAEGMRQKLQQEVA